MLGFEPQKRKKESAQSNAGKRVAPISPQKTPSAQAQALNQQPDSVPAMVKPGEYVLPADTVDAVGGQQALDGVVQATHTQAPNTAVVPQGFEPQYFFSQGGGVPDEEKRRLAQVPASMQRRENTTFEQPAAPAAPRPARDPGIASAAMALPQDNAPTFASMAAQGKSTPPVPVAAPLSAPTQPTPSEMGVAVPPSPDNIFPGNRLNGASGFSGAPIRNSDLAPAAPPAPPVARNPAVTSAAMGLPQDNGPEMFSTPQMRASLSVPKPAAPVQAPVDTMAGKAATGFHPNMMNKAQRAPNGVPQNDPANAQSLAADPQVQSDRAAMGGAWNAVKDMNDSAGRAIADVATLVPRGLAGAYDTAVVRPMRAAGINAGFVSPLLAPNGSDPASLTPFMDQKRAASGFSPAQPPASATQGAAPVAPAAPATPAERQVANTAPVAATAAAPAAGGATGAQVAEGVYSHGRGQYSDNAQGMGFSPGFTGRPNAQNMGAADALAQSTNPEATYLQGRMQGGGQSQQPSSSAAANTPAIAGLLDSGNIDLTKRPVVKNDDGSISTVRSTSVNFDGKEYLIPTVSDDGRIMSEEEAVQQFKASGKHLGVFSNPQDATAYAKELSANQARMYGAAATTGQPASAPQAQSPVGMTPQAAQAAGLIGERIGGAPQAQQQPFATSRPRESWSEFGSRMAALERGFVPGQVPQFRAPTVNTSANDFTTREALRRAKMDASSLIHSSSWAPKGSARAAQARYGQMQQADLAAQAQQGQMDMQAMGFNAGMAREQLQQNGALQRTLIGQSSDAARLGLEERRLTGEETARGFQVRQGQRLEQAQDAYMKAKTPQEQASALATMRALSGKGEGSLKDNYMSLGGGQKWDTQANTMRNVPQRLIDLRTGQEVGGQKALPPINQNPQALAIKNNTSMNSDQKRKALQELGYR